MTTADNIWVNPATQDLVYGYEQHKLNIERMLFGPTASSEHRWRDDAKVDRLEAIDFVTLDDAADVLIAEHLGIKVWTFSTGVGERKIVFEWVGGDDLRQRDIWEHQPEAWVKRADYAAIKCLRTIATEDGTFRIVSIDFKRLLEDVAAIRWSAAPTLAPEPVDGPASPSFGALTLHRQTTTAQARDSPQVWAA